MKKSIIVVLCCVLCGMFAFSLSSCSTSSFTDNPRMSELRRDILLGENEKYNIVVVAGKRENPFAIDGKSQKEKSDFVIITLTPKNHDFLASYTYKVQVSGNEYSGEMVRHPFNQTFSAEINVKTSQAELDITINDGSDQEIKVQSVKNSNFISGQKAFEIAQKKLKKSIDAHKGMDYEIFVRLIENPINSVGGYFWYVAYVFEDNSTLALLIEPVTMEIAAIKD